MHSRCRLQALPAMPLQEVARKAGRPARLVSRQLLEAYGQLRCGLRLKYYTLPQLAHILQQQCGTLGGITGLEVANILDEQHIILTDTEWWQQEQQVQLQELAACIPTAFHSLLSLDLCCDSHAAGYSDAAAAPLAPLGTCLTALKLRLAGSDQPGSGPPAFKCFTFFQHFTCLRHLTLNVPDTTWVDAGQARDFLDSLACMPALVQLDLQTEAAACADIWLSGLSRDLPQLTCLALGCIFEWDAAALSVLRSGLTGLKRLSFTLEDPGELLDDILRALACRQGQVSLTLQYAWERWELTQPVPASLQLTDWSLDLINYREEQTIRWLLEALPAQTALTSLHVGLPIRPDVRAAEELHSSLLAMPCTLVKLALACDYPGFDAATLMEGVTRQQDLTELLLSSSELGTWSQEAAVKLAAMTRLQVLRLIDCRAAPCSFMEVVAALTQLRRLHLDDTTCSECTAAALLRLQPLQQLTRLQLKAIHSTNGPGLMVVQQLGALQELEVKAGGKAVLYQLHHWLLPLPLNLRKLAVDLDESIMQCRVACTGLGAALLDAAKLQGCTVLAPCGYYYAHRVDLP
jgi:hypothetical protein